jgi:V/A-type H+/Na+-transporting ATPase subunit I
MFRAEPLVKIRLHMLASEAADAALELARFGIYSPAQHASEQLSENPAAAYRETWMEAESRTSKLVERCGGLSRLTVPEGAEAPTLVDLEELNVWLKEVWNTCLAAYEGEVRIEEEIRHLDALQDTLGRLEHLNVDLAHLLRPDGLLAVNIGSLPAASVKRMGEALSMTGYVIYNFDTISDQVYAVIAGPRDRHDEVHGLLSQAGWRELPVPPELRTHPRTARAWLTEERKRVEEKNIAECAILDSLRGKYRAGLDEARLRVELGRPLAEAAVLGVRGRGALASLAGWIPRRHADELKEKLEHRFHGHYWLDVEEANKHEAATIPSLVHYPAWLTPFVPLVRSYGVPRYGEFDPTLPFAFTYLLLFGAMFGDVGHGAVIAFLAILFSGRLGRVAWLGIAAGAVSMLFGMFYGSVFGFEDVIQPVWISPMHDPIRMLSVAMVFGVGFIVLTLLVNAGNRLASGRVTEALFDSGGLAGLAFYIGATGGVASLAGASTLALPFWPLALAGIVTVAIYKWVETDAGFGERALVTTIETMETGINLFANTLSFVRVAAFSLNHVALALAVFTIANGLDATGHWLTILLGNVVIIVLEGGIVAIQALRLMYYEGFSRFFSGDGSEFVPLKLMDAK